MKNYNIPLLPMPIKAKPYAHQIAAFNFVCEKFGLIPMEGDSDDESHSEMHLLRESVPAVGKPSPYKPFLLQRAFLQMELAAHD